MRNQQFYVSGKKLILQSYLQNDFLIRRSIYIIHAISWNYNLQKKQFVGYL